MLAVVTLAAGCAREEFPGGKTAPDGYVNITFSSSVPAMTNVATRTVDADGMGIQNMSLFCFDEYGLFITTVTASIEASTLTTGTFDATIPNHTQRIHFVANQNMDTFQETDFLNKSESQVMSDLEGSSGMMIYWARFVYDDTVGTTLEEQIQAASPITFIRNHAKVTIEDYNGSDYDANFDGTQYFTVTGFTTNNTNAYGTVAPYDPINGFDFDINNIDFITSPQHDEKLYRITDVYDQVEEYVFPTANTADDPVSVIIRGRNVVNGVEGDELYYRIMLVDNDGNYIPLIRNRNYIINIAGNLSYGQTSASAALEGPATNNVYVSISNEVTSVRNSEYILTVADYRYVLSESDVEAGTYTLTYTLENADGTAFDENTDTVALMPTVSWSGENTVASQTLAHDLYIDEQGIAQGRITLQLSSFDEDENELRGTLLIRKGKLQRTITVVSVKEQEFNPCWVTDNIYATTTGGHVTLMFNIPETTPDELFPLTVLISANSLDIRSASGIDLPVITNEDEGYGAENEWGYKYVYTADAPGEQRVYLETVFTQSAGEEGTITIEANHFGTLTKTYVFADDQYGISATGLYSFDGTSGSYYPDDESINYYVVPQKINAPFTLTATLTDLSTVTTENPTGTLMDAGEYDEFVIYTSNLTSASYFDEYGVGTYCSVIVPDAAVWEQYYPQSGPVLCAYNLNNNADGHQTGIYPLSFKTARPVSDEMIRLASNASRSPAVIQKNGTATTMDDGSVVYFYKGNSYRSFTFDLFNFDPFRFSARVVAGGTTFGEDLSEAAQEDGEDEVLSEMTLTYEPEQTVDILIDVTSYSAKGPYNFVTESADPFGTEFEIYIDAPMLVIDEARLAACNLNADKLKADPNVEGRFIYTVDADRATERGYGNLTALKTDASLPSDQTQEGERKTLPFKVENPVSEGEIVISANEEKVIYYPKTFDVTNTPITGNIKLTMIDGTIIELPAGSYVSLQLVRNYSRIGFLTITETGKYSLTLRDQYQFDWYTDRIEFNFTYDYNNTPTNFTDDRHYTAEFGSLSELFETENHEINLIRSDVDSGTTTP